MPSPWPHPSLRQLTLLAAGVLLVHLLGLAWLAQRGTAPGALTLMAEPAFNRVLTPGATPSHPAADGIGAWPPPTATVGQVVQARTLAPSATEPGNAGTRPSPPHQTPQKPANGRGITAPTRPHTGGRRARPRTPCPGDPST